MAFLQIVTILAIISIASCGHYPPGYSYAKFSGPVSGPEKEIVVSHGDDHHGHGHTVDYVAKPDYHFAYGVEDPKSKVSQSRKETRHGDAVHGEYSVVDPDGVLRTVKYTADKKNGFQAEVITSGKSNGGGGGNGGGGDGGHGGHEESGHLESQDDDDSEEYY